MKRILMVSVLLGIGSYSCGSPEEHFKNQITEPVSLPYNSILETLKLKEDWISKTAETEIPDLPAQDEIVLQEDLGRAFIASMDGWIWKADLKRKTAEPFVKTSLLPAGMVAHPKNKDVLFFCVSRAKEGDADSENGPGIYELTISEKRIRRIGTRVPLDDGRVISKRSGIGVLYPDTVQKTLEFSKMNETNSRNVEKADDLAISRDGERIYFTEPYNHSKAILGVSSQSRKEVFTLGKNGRLWKYDLKNERASLVAEEYSYLDGILLEYEDGEKETAAIVNELSKSRLLRLYLRGERAGRDEIVIDGIPGFPDGMDRDSRGRIWIALPVERSKLVTWLHEHPFWKKLLLYVPDRLFPVSKKTGIVALSPDGTKPLFYTMYDGERFSQIIVVVPGKDKLYLAVYQEGHKGLVALPYPPDL
ncbi:hypothetical protein CH379_016165 [Leptospira ellisii]|uniref:SMP-30/gluconolaconase/LRE-like region n=2 Tax=Leptospira ellisii TaxID=2023197 RepID=A0AAE4QQ79_9LEPT|nr:hypothetical protein [Leptospira ellisii]MDV6237168.1 hypothetical protein [Leptospira ellisii]